MLRQIMLGDEGLTFMRACLNEGGKLSQIAQAILSSRDGSCFTPMPEHVGYERALEFEAGGLMPRKMHLDWIEDRVLSFCNKDRKSLFVVEDRVLRRGDKSVTELPVNFFYLQNAVHFFVECKSASLGQVEAALREVRSFRFVAFLIEGHDGLHLTRGSSLEDAMLSQIGERISEIFLSAYDQEGIVVWSRSE